LTGKLRGYEFRVLWCRLRAKVGNVARLLGRVISEWHEALQSSRCYMRDGVRDARWRWTGLLHRSRRRIRGGWMKTGSGVLDAFAVLLG